MTDRPLLLVLSFLLVLPLMFGGFFHAVVPHDHSDNGVITNNMHASFLHEEKFLLAVPNFSAFFSIIVATSVLVVSYNVLKLGARMIWAGGAYASSLRRGVFSYRKFL